MESKWGQRIVLSLVTVVWATNFVAPFMVEGYESKESINVIFMGIVGWRFVRRDRTEERD